MGQDQDDTGLSYYGARYDDAVLGKFVSADSAARRVRHLPYTVRSRVARGRKTARRRTMLGRISYVLVIGLLIGMIATGAGVAIAARHEAAPPPARGDLNAPFDLALTITEAFFTEQVNHPQATQPGETVANQSRLRDATVRLRSDGTIEVRGKAPVLGITVPVRAVLMPRIVDNQLQLAIIEGQAGGLGVPDAVVKDIESALNRQLRATLAKNAFQVIALQPGEGTLLIHLK